MAKLTGERPMQGVTPDSLLALHAAGYRAVLERVGPGRLLDVGCGQGFESVRLVAPDRTVFGVDYSHAALRHAAGLAARTPPDALVGHRPAGSLLLAQMDAGRLALGRAVVDWACSSHLIEHFPDPEPHVAELARILRPTGTAFVLTPNEPADFENPFHVHLFRAEELRGLLSRYFEDVVVAGLDAGAAVKQDFAERRRRARRVLALDVLGLRHRIPRSWYVGVYTRVLPLAYRLVARGDTGGATGITADDFFVTDEVDDTTLVLFGIARRPRPQRA